MAFTLMGLKICNHCSYLLHCIILFNVVLIFWIGRYLLSGGRNTFTSGSEFILQEQQLNMQQQRILSDINIQDSLNEHEPPISVDKAPVVQLKSLLIDINRFKDPSAASVMQLRKIAESAELNPNLGDPANMINTIATESISKTDENIVIGDEKGFGNRLRSLLNCYDRPYKPEILQRGDFWVLQNYVRADHGELKCHESITYTTHADYTFLDSLIPLLERWKAPVSIALYAPGNDFQPTLDSIRYLRDCLPESNLVRMYATFHIYFNTKHIPEIVPMHQDILKVGHNCKKRATFGAMVDRLYRIQKQLFYPINVGRNIARDAALTHFILASDMEMYPSMVLVNKFLKMIARNETYLQRTAPRVFPLPIFKVETNSAVPRNKTELQEMLRTSKAIPFQESGGASCHRMPKSKEWMVANETEELNVFYIGKRINYFVNWEPVHIGTHADPHYDERISWEGKCDKVTQAYALCALDYEFHILDNAFLVHKPGTKIYESEYNRGWLMRKTNKIIRTIIYPELKVLYGTRPGCAIHT
ncbi:beta-1,4-glucuronyltransferase 1-like [Teleopsis dalmanni]|uniref:beta-1,4-glucuronyltransferase 1-like n=1 Tax=Teleopsis dalmanni TaxID=139649 RepID=UPI0018CF56B5|nr:beta-1,4-glucuronyltransferase 1-like [Teleopsis dalmanni]XP_037959355.1 beta-1,4-glucuronyltransferase 1-like [Teleopsis dalmanni]XP_037959356.1 beta-1,4-glucuronyltransferase 1-like [Teleopsis dalmanni]